MEFVNSQISLDKLPKAEETDLIPIDRRYFRVLTYQKILLWGIVIAGAGAGILFYEKLQRPTFALPIIIFLIVAMIADFRISYLSFRNMAFALREHDILYQDGWLIKKLHAFPFNRIQHCSVNSGYLERQFDLSSLKIYTAGGSDSDISIPGLTSAQAAGLRELIIEKNKAE